MFIKNYKLSIKIFSRECECKRLSNNIILYYYMNSFKHYYIDNKGRKVL